MKKYLFPLTIALVAVASCKEPVSGGEDYPTPEANVAYTLEGSVKADGFAWKEGAVLGVFSEKQGVAFNAKATIKAEDAGKASASFTTIPLTLSAGENKFMVYYPHDASVVYLNGKFSSVSIAEAQSQAAPNTATDGFAYGSVSGIPGVDDTFKFELTPLTATVAIKMTSTEFADYAPKKISIASEDADLAGKFDIEPSSGTITPTAGVKEAYVSVEAAKKFSEVAEQTIYLHIIPANLDGKQITMIVELQGDEGSRSIPMSIDGKNFVAGKTTEINVENLSESMINVKWFVTDDSRYVPSSGVAYGPANTFFIQCKNGQTYNGATYSANAQLSDEVTFDYKARGSFANAIEPVGVTFEWMKTINGDIYTNAANNLAVFEGSGVVSSEYSEPIVDTENMTVTVKNTGAFAGSPILLMKKDGKVLWAWTFWNVAADGTDPFASVNVGGYEFLPMYIGQATTQYDTWVANKTSKGNNDPVYRTVNYYQWGRPMPTFWNRWWSPECDEETNMFNPAIWGPVSLQDALAHPGEMIIAKRESYNVFPEWCTNPTTDLWGVEGEEASEGAKSIYDPCPKGYRVMSKPAVDALVVSGSATFTANDATTRGKRAAMVDGLTFLTGGRLACKWANATSTQLQFFSCGEDGGANEGFVWTNFSATQGQTLYIKISDKLFQNGQNDRANALPVRCIKDNDNR